jgi:putative Mg2+ transporter-C (MgtC) family protein
VTGPPLRLSYADGHGVLRAALTAWTERGFTVRDIDVTREDLDDDGSPDAAVTLELAGRGDLSDLAGELTELLPRGAHRPRRPRMRDQKTRR